MTRIDFHTHILPGIDDGAQHVDQSVEMLRRMADARVETVVLSPHYFALDEQPADFVRRSQDALHTLQQAWAHRFGDQAMPRLLLGAEVYLERNLLLVEGIRQLCIADTDLFLIEFPTSEYREWMYSVMFDLSAVYGVSPVVAHVERLLPWIKKQDLARLLDIPGISFQFNHSAFQSKSATRFMLKLFERGYPVFFGSDCHDLQMRPPTQDHDLSVIEEWLERKVSAGFSKQVGWVQQHELQLI